MGKKQSHPELGHQGNQSLYSFQLKNQQQILREKLTWVVTGLGLGVAVTVGVALLSPAHRMLFPGLNLPLSQSSPETALAQGLDQGMRAAEMTQSAELREEWIEVAMVWQSAINYLRSVSQVSQDYDLAQQKIAEYGRNLKYAESNVNTRPSRSPLTRDHWTLGSDRELVLNTQGLPDEIRQLSSSCYETLHYGASMIELKNGYVKSYDNFDNNLKVLSIGEMALSTQSDDRHWTLGSLKSKVLQLQGTPDRSNDFQSDQFTTLYYGDSFVLFDQDRVVGYLNTDNSLKVSTLSLSLPQASPAADSWSLGSSRLAVLKAQKQTPYAVSRSDDGCEEVFHFGNSEVLFRQGIVTGYRNVDQNLKLR
jgi:hypothetical protein